MPNPKREKVCRECGVPGLHYTVQNGKYIRNPCVACFAKRRSDWWAAVKQDPEKLEEVRARQRAQASSEKGKARHRAYLKTDRGKEIRRRYTSSEKAKARRRERRSENAARAAVRQALKEGVLARPSGCEACGGVTPHETNPSGLEAHHHKGYMKEHHLDVQWLCIPCHRKADGAASGLGGGARWHGPDRATWPDHVKGSETDPAFRGFK